jgi:hypothetical protein
MLTRLTKAYFTIGQIIDICAELEGNASVFHAVDLPVAGARLHPSSGRLVAVSSTQFRLK